MERFADFTADALTELRIAYEEMRGGYFDRGDALENAMRIVEAGGVTYTGQGLWKVKGRTQTYTVGEKCTCADTTKRHNAYCYHRCAVELQKMWNLRTGVTMPPKMSVEEPHLPLPPSTPEEHLASVPSEPTVSPTMPSEPISLPLPLGRMLRPLHAILADLRRPLPDACIPSLQRGGQDIDFLSWHQITHLLHTYAPGWYPEVTEVQEVAGPLTIRVRIVLVSAEGKTAYEGVGRDNGSEFTGKDFGDKARRAYARALKHAAQLLGMDWLQEQAERSQTLNALDTHLMQEQQGRIKALGEACEQAGLDKQAYIQALMAQACVQSWKHIPLAMLHEAVQCITAYAASRKDGAA